MESCTSNFSNIFHSVPRHKPSSLTIGNSFFCTTNERNPQATLLSLKTIPKEGNTVIGVSGLFSLDLLSARLSAPRVSNQTIRNFIVIDKSRVVKTFWKSLSRIIIGKPGKEAPSRLEVIEKIEELMKTQKNYLFQADHRGASQAAKLEWEKFTQSIREGTSFASSDEKFKQIQRIFKKGHFQFLHMDMGNSESFKALGKVLKKHQLSPDTIYTSNIEDWLERSDRLEKFHESIRAIKEIKTLLVDSYRNDQKESSLPYGLIQRIQLPDGSLISSI